MVCSLVACGTSSNDNSQVNSNLNEVKKTLVVYFSATGNTQQIAENIVAITDADLFEIVPQDDYSSEDLNYNDDNCRANQEQQDKSIRPEINGSIENMDQYGVVLIGYPIWWAEEPRIIDTFMEAYDLSGKTIVCFCTSGGSGIDASIENLKQFAPDATWLEGKRFETGSTKQEIEEWVNSLDIYETN